MNKMLHVTVFVSLFYTTVTAPQAPEGNEALEITDPVTNTPAHNDSIKDIDDNVLVIRTKEAHANAPDAHLSVRLYRLITDPLYRVLQVPKVNIVLRNIGTCLVNGAMELLTFYLPPPMLPLVASAAGLVIPFEPVVMLKEKMPVTSYRRAFKTAMNTFLSTFDQYKMEDDYDPYMTRRFNRRFMDDDTKKTTES